MTIETKEITPPAKREYRVTVCLNEDEVKAVKEYVSMRNTSNIPYNTSTGASLLRSINRRIADINL